MKYLLFAFTFITFLVYPKFENDDMYVITYKTSHKLFNDWDRYFEEYSVLLVHEDKSLYQSLNKMRKDSLSMINKSEELRTNNEYFTFNNYVIESKEDKTEFFSSIGPDLYHYAEKINFDWKITSEKKTIKGYQCYKATVDYAGRSWTAWFASEISVPFGPYKFKGLPGLIVSIHDSTNSYKFEVDELKVKTYTPFRDFFLNSNTEINEVSRSNFNKIEFVFNGLSLNEKLNFNKEQKNAMFVELESDGTTPLRDTSNTRKNNNSNPIELH